MTSHAYEVALFGEFFPQDLPGIYSPIVRGVWIYVANTFIDLAILNRFTLHSESAHQMHAREIVFEPFDAQHQRDSGTEPVLLRARKELLEPDAKW